MSHVRFGEPVSVANRAALVAGNLAQGKLARAETIATQEQARRQAEIDAVELGRERVGFESDVQGLELGQQEIAAGEVEADTAQIEFDRFTDEENLRSMASFALSLKGQPDPAKRTELVNRRLEEITSRGGDPRDTQEFLTLSREEQDVAIDSVLTTAEAFNIIEPPKKKTEKKAFTNVREAVVDGKLVFMGQNPKTGQFEKIPGFEPSPKANEVLNFDTETGILTITKGVSTTPGKGLDKINARKLEQNLLDNTTMLSQLQDIDANFDADFLTIPGAVGAFFTKAISKLGGDPSPEAAEFLGKRRAFTEKVNRMFNEYRRRITGAAASVQELSSLKDAMLNEDLSPIEFQQSWKSFNRELLRSNRLQRRMLRDGVTGKFGPELDRLFKTGADDDIEVRGAELRGLGLPDDEIASILIREGYVE